MLVLTCVSHCKKIDMAKNHPAYAEHTYAIDALNSTIWHVSLHNVSAIANDGEA